MEKENGTVKLHLGCGEKYLEGYVNIDFPEGEHTVMRPKADIYGDIQNLSYAENSVDEIRSHHMFEHFVRAEALKLLVRWRKWLKPGGLLVIETPDFLTSAQAYCNAFSMRRKSQLVRHIIGSQEAGWAQHKDLWDKQKFSFVLKKMGFYDLVIRCYGNGVAKHAANLPKIGKMLGYVPESLRIPFLNIAGDILPERFYQKYGGNKMPNILVMARKDANIQIDDEAVAKEILSLSLTGKEDHRMLGVWMEQYKKF